MSLGIIQRERTAYGRVRVDEKGGRKRGEGRERAKKKSTAMSVKILNKFL